MPRTSGSTRRTVYDELRRRVVSLALPPGSPVSENEIAADLGVSRTPVREAMIMLVQDGLVQVFPKVGSFVTRVDLRRVADSQFVREAVELASLADVPAEPDRVVVGELTVNLARQRVCTDNDEFFQLDEEFHRGLLRLAGHEGTWPAVVAAKAHLDRARRLGLEENRSPEVFAEQHAAVLDALLASGPGAAVPLLRSHLRAVFDDIERVRERSPELFAPSAGRPTRRSVAVWE
ncbi:GntR family transcriptional regulator [Cellulomonas sp. C5510]|uniref:GntR family transcriptional regulator n=1 Tax=Cellulomonas sp. C5510 TaxID=2871170 RepID=UPI001C97DE20|nr:GntR family transcriptional regulator [Cellulomonas sp. C5510]QZN85376.1 GntR family transcriptional regulator [Cellulomonas sp. C5510]